MHQPLQIGRAPGRGWIVLIGGGEFSFGETREIDEFVLSKMPEGNRRAAFIPAASGSNEYGGHFAAYVKTLAPEIEMASVPVFRARDARRGKNIAMVGEAGLIYVGGGVASMAIDAIRGTPLVETIREALARGAVVAGIGGGASAIAAVGLLNETAIQAPFDPERDVLLRSQMAHQGVRIGIGIPARCAVAIGPDGNAEIVGEGSLTVMRRG
jgi:cyanophycinase-like exopeptidase